MPSPTIVLLRTQSDERLVALARTGHERAFEAIVERYRKPLLRACRRMLPEARAEDAVQQALVAAWTGLSRGDEVRDLRPWLYRIAHNTALNQLRIAGYDYDELHGMLDDGPAPEEELERREVARRTLTGLAALPPRQREALLQIAVQGRGQEEVARAMGVSEPAVRQLVHRARTHLRTAATALTPMPVAGWLADFGSRSGPLAGRIGEIAAGGSAAGAAATAAKLGAVVVLAGGAAAGGPGVVDRLSHDHAGARAAERRSAAKSPPASTHATEVVSFAATPAAQHGTAAAPAAPAAPAATPVSRRTQRHRGSRGSDRDDDSSGSSDHNGAPLVHRRSGGSGSGDDDDDHSGSDSGESSGASGDDGVSGDSGSGGGRDDDLAAPTPEPTSEPIDESDDHSGSTSGGTPTPVPSFTATPTPTPTSGDGGGSGSDSSGHDGSVPDGDLNIAG